jgi:hypothetical protein
MLVEDLVVARSVVDIPWTPRSRDSLITAGLNPANDTGKVTEVTAKFQRPVKTSQASPEIPPVPGTVDLTGLPGILTE